jgi:predicted RNA-binding Zn-ribbon protein involved in translation (DUF1610 family)
MACNENVLTGRAMPDSDPFLCPACGWTGDQAETVEFDHAIECPICAEFVERASREETSESDTIMCPMCGWTGEQDKLEHTDRDTRCAICAGDIELVE